MLKHGRNLVCCNILKVKIVINIHMISYFHYTRVCRGVIYHIMPNFICYSREKRVKNLVTKLKTKSMKNYLLECCSGGAKTCNFGTTVKPFCSKKKCNSGEQKIILCENLFIQGSGFFLGRLVLTGACLFSICMKESWYCM
jgi:hypothetical protein